MSYEYRFLTAINIDKDSFWFFDYNSCSICSCSLLDYSVAVVAKCHEEIGYFNPSLMVLVDGTIYMSGALGAKVLSYNIECNEFKLYECDDSNDSFTGVWINNELYLIKLGNSLRSNIYKFSVEKRTLDLFGKIDVSRDQTGGICVCNKEIYIPVRRSNVYYRYSIEDNSIKKNILDDDISLYSVYSICEKLYFTDTISQRLVICDGEKIEYEYVTGRLPKYEEAFSRIVETDEGIVILPRNSEYLYYKRKDDKEWEEIPTYIINKEKYSTSLFCGLNLYKGKIILLPWRVPDIYVVDMVKCNMHKYELDSPRYFSKKNRDDIGIFYETNTDNLEQLIAYLDE